MRQLMLECAESVEKGGLSLLVGRNVGGGVVGVCGSSKVRIHVQEHSNGVQACMLLLLVVAPSC